MYHFLKLEFVKFDFDTQVYETRVGYDIFLFPFQHFHYLLSVSHDGVNIH